jgi:hypothetical protein
MASIITGMTVPDNTDPRGQNIIPSTNVIRDAGDPNSADTVRANPPPVNQNPQQFFLGGIETATMPKDEVGKIVVDVLRNTSINGVFPTVTGGTIDFSLPTSTASEKWSQQNWTGMSMSTYTNNAPTNHSNVAVFSANNSATDESKIASSESKARPVSDSNVEIANSRSRSVSDSNVEIANSRSRPVSDSNVEVANSRARPISDSKIEVANSKATPLTDSDRRVANPMSNTLSRRRSNEQAGDVNTVTPLYVKSADGSSAMVVYMHEAHTISIDPDTTVGDTITDSMSGETIAPSQYFLSGGGGEQFPFKISVTSGKNPKYKVSYNSSIINGTNGGPYNIANLNEDISITSQKFIIAEADVTSAPFKVSDSGFTIKEVDDDETDEVVVDTSGEFLKQTKLRLLIGKITVEDLPNNGGKLLRPWQAVTTSFRTAMSYHNGAAVFILQAAPTHQSRI